MTRARRLIGIAAALCLLGGCGQIGALVAADEGQQASYPVPIEHAAELIARVEEPPMVFGDGPVTFALREETATRLVWVVAQGDVEVMRYTADLEAAGVGATSVQLSLTGITSAEFGNVEERLHKHPAIRQLYLLALQEAIAAELERRPFRMERIYPAMVDATFQLPGIFQDHGEAFQRQDRENMEKAYREERW